MSKPLPATPPQQDPYEEAQKYGKSFKQSRERYIALLTKAAESGVLQAFEDLVDVLPEPETDRAKQKLRRIFEMCCDQLLKLKPPNSKAFYRVAQYYRNPYQLYNCVEQDEDAVLQWLLHAADAGHSHSLPVALTHVKRSDPRAAYRYYKLMILQDTQDNKLINSFVNFLKYDGGANAHLLVEDWALHQKLTQRVQTQDTEIADLKAKLEHMSFAPGGPGYQDALEDYKTRHKKRKRS